MSDYEEQAYIDSLFTRGILDDKILTREEEELDENVVVACKICNSMGACAYDDYGNPLVHVIID